MRFQRLLFIKSFLLLFMACFLAASNARAQGTASCYINVAGDYICPLGANSGSGGNPFLSSSGGPSSVTTFGTGTPLYNSLSGVSGFSPGLLAQLSALLDSLPGSLKDLLIDELIKLLSQNADAAQILDLINKIQALNGDLSSLTGLLCPGGGSISADMTSYANSSAALNFASSFASGKSFDVNSMVTSMCSSPSSGSGSGSGSVGGEGGERIAQAAESMINASTADHPDTQGGKVGCAVAVTRILEKAGYGIGILPGTSTLYDKLKSDPCFEEVDTGSIDSTDAMNLQRGDVLVTSKNSSTGRAGHTGIYVGNGEIISNSSSGFAGSAPGTIQKNYSVQKWNSGVITRNPSRSSVFRRTCP